MRQIVNIVGVVTLNQQAALLAHAARQMKAEDRWTFEKLRAALKGKP